MELVFERVVLPDDADAVVSFLCASEWPFHGTPRLSATRAASLCVIADDVESFWIRDAGTPVGIVRLLDLDDVDDGSPLFDLRIASGHRGRGVGTAAVRWLSDHLITNFDQLHRIEATTRNDNTAMMAVLERCGYRLEGVLREAWRCEDGSRYDTMLYGLLRREWSSAAT